MNYKIKECPACHSKEIEIQERYLHAKRTNEYTLKCRNCNYSKSQLAPF